jgi:hypothetical protein
MNPLQNPKYIKLRDLILASEGKTIEDELGEGCYYTLNGHGGLLRLNGDNYVLNESKKGIYIDSICNHNSCQACGERIETKVNSFSFDKILGRSVSLDRIMLSLGLGYGILNLNGVRIFVYNRFRGQVRREICEWDLEHPLHLQSEEVWDRLIDILIQGK